jgi:protein SCO1/2
VRLGFFALFGAVLLAGTAALGWETEGFRVVTSDGARQLAVARRPVPLPDVPLFDQDGGRFLLSDYRGGRVLVDFIYTRCPRLCGVLGDDFHRVLALAKSAPEGRDVDLLSISFDRENDDRAALAGYGEGYGATAPRWRVAVPADDRSLAVLLRSFGVVVIPDGIGGFIHNGAVYLVDRRGRLADILDPDAPPQRFAAALRRSAR